MVTYRATSFHSRTPSLYSVSSSSSVNTGGASSISPWPWSLSWGSRSLWRSGGWSWWSGVWSWSWCLHWPNFPHADWKGWILTMEVALDWLLKKVLCLLLHYCLPHFLNITTIGQSCNSPLGLVLPCWDGFHDWRGPTMPEQSLPSTRQHPSTTITNWLVFIFYLSTTNTCLSLMEYLPNDIFKETSDPDDQIFWLFVNPYIF